tara:strand:+ start:387 stop:848 length:462 start_codon:yes stop_codon:yes gene_type:complete
MIKKISLVILILFTASCGYEAMHTSKNRQNYDFSISKISFEGDKVINSKIEGRLNAYRKSSQNKNLTLKVNSRSEKVILAKNVSGNTTTFNNTVTVEVEISIENKVKDNLILKETFNYSNTSNKFQLKNYEKEIKNNLAETIADKLIFKLSNI